LTWLFVKMWFKVHRNVNDIRKQIIVFIKKHIIILVFCWCNHLWRSGKLFFVHFLMSVSGFRWWDHKPLLWLWRVKCLSFKKVSFSSGGRVQVLWVVLLVCVYVRVRHSIFYAFSVRVMNWFVREKDDYMFLYENYYLFSYIIDISVDF
jgi:hypothetical protein